MQTLAYHVLIFRLHLSFFSPFICVYFVHFLSFLLFPTVFFFSLVRYISLPCSSSLASNLSDSGPMFPLTFSYHQYIQRSYLLHFTCSYSLQPLITCFSSLSSPVARSSRHQTEADTFTQLHCYKYELWMFFFIFDFPLAFLQIFSLFYGFYDCPNILIRSFQYSVFLLIPLCFLFFFLKIFFIFTKTRLSPLIAQFLFLLPLSI